METIVKCSIEKLAFPVDGYTYNVMEWRSVDGGKNFWHCGHGRYCRTLHEAEQYAFSVDGDRSHLPVLCKENAEEGAAYQFGGSVLYVKRIYRINEEYARKNNLAYLERVETSMGDFALPGGDTINAARA